ncbi:hypothetical protein R6Q59_028217 [Mikania micrantha]
MAPKPSKASRSSTSSSSKNLLSVSSYEINWTPIDFEGFLQEFRILPEWHPELPSQGSTALDAPLGKICLYADFFRFSHFRLPISISFLRMLERLVKKDDWYYFDRRGGPSMVLKVPSSSWDKN